MISVRIKDANAAAGQPADWDIKHGTRETVYVRRQNIGGKEVLFSAWKPSGLELEMLRAGGSVVLGLVTKEHPTVMMYVSDED